MPTFNADPQTYPQGETTAFAELPVSAEYSAFHLTVDYSPWSSPLTTLVRVGMDVSYDDSATWQQVTHADQVDPPPWAGRWGTSSESTIEARYPDGLAPSQVRGWVYAEGLAHGSAEQNGRKSSDERKQ